MSVKFTDYTKDRQNDIVLHALFRDSGPMTDREIAMVIPAHSPDIVVPLQLLLEAEYIDVNKIEGDWMYTITEKGKEVVMSPEFFANKPVEVDVKVTRRTPDDRTSMIKAAQQKVEKEFGKPKQDGRSKGAKAAREAEAAAMAHAQEATLASQKSAHALEQGGGLKGFVHAGGISGGGQAPVLGVYNARTNKRRCTGCRMDRPDAEFEGDGECIFCVRSKAPKPVENVANSTPLAGQILMRTGSGDQTWVYPEAPKFGIFSNGEMHINVPGAQTVNGVLVLNADVTRALFDFMDNVPEKMLAPRKEGGAS